MQLEHNLNQRHVKLVCLQNNLWDQKMKKTLYQHHEKIKIKSTYLIIL